MHDIQRKAQAMQERIVQWRRALHAMPEVGFDTPGTERFIVAELQKMGVTEIRHGDGKKGIVALVQGKKPGGVLGIRADYDALHMTEETGLPFAATNGNMHACGHDAHAAILLGTANLLLDCADHIGQLLGLLERSETVLDAELQADDPALRQRLEQAIDAPAAPETLKIYLIS